MEIKEDEWEEIDINEPKQVSTSKLLSDFKAMQSELARTYEQITSIEEQEKKKEEQRRKDIEESERLKAEEEKAVKDSEMKPHLAETLACQERQAKAVEYIASTVRDLILKERKEPESTIPVLNGIASTISLADDRIIANSGDEKEDVEITGWDVEIERDDNMLAKILHFRVVV